MIYIILCRANKDSRWSTVIGYEKTYTRKDQAKDDLEWLNREPGNEEFKLFEITDDE